MLDRIMATQGWDGVRRILAVRLDSMGDVLMTTPALRALKERFAGSHLTILTSDSGAEVSALIPEIDQAIVYHPPWMKATAPLADSHGEYMLAAQLRQGGYDAAVIFTVYSQSPLPAALLTFLAGIPLRLAHCRENPYQLLTDWVPETEPEQGIRHEVQRQLDVVAHVGAFASDERLSLRVPETAITRAASLLQTLGVDLSAPWVAIHPGATAPARRYPPELFAEAARHLVEDHGFQVVFTGVKTEASLVNSIQKQMNAPSWTTAGRLDLPGLGGLLSLAHALISNNSGPVHLAAALGTPVIDLYALTNPQHTPWMTPSRVLSHEVPCKYCYKSVCPLKHNDCLRKIEPGQVVAATLDLLSQASGFSPAGLSLGLTGEA